MNEKGLIKYDEKTIITDITEKVQKEKVGVPICGSISCDSPIEEQENIETIVSLPASIFGTDDSSPCFEKEAGGFFLLECKNNRSFKK